MKVTSTNFFLNILMTFSFLIFFFSNSQLRRLLDCSRRAVGDCFESGYDEEIQEVFEEFQNQSKRLCEADRKDDESINGKEKLILVIISNY